MKKPPNGGFFLLFFSFFLFYEPAPSVRAEFFEAPVIARLPCLCEKASGELAVLFVKRNAFTALSVTGTRVCAGAFSVVVAVCHFSLRLPASACLLPH